MKMKMKKMKKMLKMLKMLLLKVMKVMMKRGQKEMGERGRQQRVWVHRSGVQWALAGVCAYAHCLSMAGRHSMP